MRFTSIEKKTFNKWLDRLPNREVGIMETIVIIYGLNICLGMVLSGRFLNKNRPASIAWMVVCLAWLSALCVHFGKL